MIEKGVDLVMRSNEFVGIAEGIKSLELSTKDKIEKCKGKISELSETKQSLYNQISYLKANLEAAYAYTDEDGGRNYSRIAAIESQINYAESKLSEVETQLDIVNGELFQSQVELKNIIEDKTRTLSEIQERAKKTSQNIAFAGGMYGAYAGVGSTLQGSMQTSLASLSKAASILDGSVEDFSGTRSKGQGLTDVGSSSSQGGLRELSTSALSAFSIYMDGNAPTNAEEIDEQSTDAQDNLEVEEQLNNITEQKKVLEKNTRTTSSDVSDNSAKSTFNSLSDYMNAHNYRIQDFATYSQDPEWRALQREAFPEYELPPLTQENAYNQLSDYMNSHNYGSDDFDTYSKDPQWRELQAAAFPDYELPPIQSAEYSLIVNSLNDVNVAYRPIELACEQRTPDDIINQLGGEDLTEGSCSSLAFAYAGNKAGYNVLDFRDGDSRAYFSDNDSIKLIANLPEIDSKTILGTDDIRCVNELLNGMENGKEYYLATGLHASVVRKADSGYEFLELQSVSNNGWKPLNDSVLRDRFGCISNNEYEYPNFLIDVDSLGKSEEFRNILGYINTAEANQMK